MPVPSESFGNFDLVRRVILDFTDVVGFEMEESGDGV